MTVKTTISIRRLTTCIFLSGICIGIPRVMLGQCSSDQYPQFGAGPVGGTVQVTSADISAGFGFEMHYYDSSRTMYRVADFHQNHNRIILLSWCLGQEILGSSHQILGDSSRTQSITLATGDTIRFFRELAWFDPLTMEQTPSNYLALDTLDYVVELVSTINDARLALLDSIGILRTPVRTIPIVYGALALMEKIEYVVPFSQNGISARIYIRPQARGSGPQHFGRSDRWAIGLSKRLNDSLWNAYISAFGNALGLNRTLGDLNDDNVTRVTLDVFPNPSTGRFSISFDPAGRDEVTRVIVFNEQGQRVFIPVFMPAAKVGVQSVEYYQETPGTYFVALYHGTALMRTVKVVVGR